MGSIDRKTEIRWASRVPPEMIRRLYEGEARGMLDEDLLEDVFLRIYGRCLSIIDVTEAGRGRIRCPVCRTVIEMPEGFRQGKNAQGDQPIVCPKCPWRCTWGEFFRSYQKKQLVAGGAEPFVREFVAGVPAARCPRDRLLMIDRLIHRFHTWQKDIPTRPTAVNVIAGSVSEVGRLIEELAYGDTAAPEMLANRRDWQEQWQSARRMWTEEE